MPAGRKKLPLKLHVLNGTDRPCRRNEDEPIPDIPKEIPKPPDFLSDSAKVEWVTMAEKLYNLGLLTEIDHSALALYCQAWGEFKDAQKEIYGDEEKGVLGKGFTTISDKGNELQHPLVGISHNAMQIAHKFLTEFGMTPASRSKTKGSTPVKKENKFSGNAQRAAS